MTVYEGPAEGPTFDHYSTIPMFNTKAVVQQTGIAAPTLRAWERRYALLTPVRADNDYRLYSERDIALIRWIKERTDEGMAISQAIALYRHLSAEQQSRAPQITSSQLAEELASPAIVESTTTNLAPLEPPQERAADRLEQKLLEETAGAASIQAWARLAPSYLHHSNYQVLHNTQSISDRLIDAFRSFNEPLAMMLMGTMLAIYPIEQICTELITPTMYRIGKLWEEGQITVSVEHFASHIFRSLLINLFYVIPSLQEGPLAIICCAPGETHELGALMLALFLRRKNIHVTYLGQSIETVGLLHTIKKLQPLLICTSLTTSAHLPELIELGQQVQHLATPRPTFVFGGQVFLQHANAIPHIPGLYLNRDLQAVADQLQKMVFEYKKTNT